MTGRPDNPYDEAPAAWAMWQWVSARVTQDEAWEFNDLMRAYRDEIRAEAASGPVVTGGSASAPQAGPSH